MNKYKVGDRVYWKSEKEKVKIDHINIGAHNQKVIWIKSSISGIWCVYPEALKPIMTVRA